MQIVRAVIVLIIAVSGGAWAQTEAAPAQPSGQTESRSERSQELRQRRDRMMQEMKSDMAQMRSMLEKMRADAQKVKDQAAKAALLQNADMWQAMLDSMQEKMDRMNSSLMGRPRRNRVRSSPLQQGQPGPTNPSPQQ